jgi:hypothetical protein
LDRNDVEIEPFGLTLPARHHQADLFQHPKMFHRPEPAEGEVLGQLANGEAGVGLQQIQHLPPARIGKRAEPRQACSRKSDPEWNSFVETGLLVTRRWRLSVSRYGDAAELFSNLP